MIKSIYVDNNEIIVLNNDGFVLLFCNCQLIRKVDTNAQLCFDKVISSPMCDHPVCETILTHTLISSPFKLK